VRAERTCYLELFPSYSSTYKTILSVFSAIAQNKYTVEKITRKSDQLCKAKKDISLHLIFYFKIEAPHYKEFS
jgi:hypothetical protein